MSPLPGATPLPGVDETPTVPEGKDHIEHVSKSRITTYLQCPRKFFWKYWGEERAPGTYYTERGTEVHETFEVFHENLLDYLDEHGEVPDRFTPLLPNRGNWQQWTEMIGEFFRFELRRHEMAYDSIIEEYGRPYSHNDIMILQELVGERWEPIDVEAEFWLGEPPQSWFEVEHGGQPDYVDGSPPVGDAPWMGRADLVVRTETIPSVEGTGATIIDYKTGTAPTIKYEGKPWLEENLEEGIFLEGEFYGWLAEENDEFGYEVDAVAGYYPENDELIVSTYPDTDRRRDIKRAVLGMQRTPDIENYDVDESPLCHYNNSKNHGQCWFYDVCEIQRDCADCHPESDTQAERYSS